jgi:hypothetical protein
MRKYKTKEVTVAQYVVVGVFCDGCGLKEPSPGYFTDVTIAVGEDVDGGGRDDLDFCDTCFLEVAKRLVFVGSTAELVTGEPREASK